MVGGMVILLIHVRSYLNAMDLLMMFLTFKLTIELRLKDLAKHATISSFPLGQLAQLEACFKQL